MGVIGLTLTLTTLGAFLLSARQSLLLAAAAAATGLLLSSLRKRRLRVWCVVCFVAAMGLAVHTLHDTRKVAPFARAVGEIVEVQGLVTRSSLGRRAVSYTVAATFPHRPDLPDTTLALRTFGELEYLEGDVIGATVQLDDTAPGPADYGFDKGIFVSGEVVGGVRRLSGGYPIRRRLIQLRGHLAGNIYLHLPVENADLLSAMVLGLQDNVDADIYSVVNRTGISHLLTVSGLHLSILTGFLLAGLDAARMPRQAGALSAVAAALVFSALVGFSPSIIRSCIMTAITLLARAGPRRGDSLSSLGFAVAVICLWQPTWVLGRGFWFSAGATLGIVMFGGRLYKWMLRRARGGGKPCTAAVRGLLNAAAISLCAYGFTLPLLVLFNGWIPLVSPLVNVLIAPFVTPVIAGGVLCAVFGSTALPMQLVAWITGACTNMILAIARLMAGLPWATLSMDQDWMLLWLGLVVVALVLFVLYRGGRKLAGYGCALLVLVFGAGSLSQTAADGATLELAVIENCDVAVLLRDREAVILGTPAKNETNRLLRYLEFRGVEKIRAIVAADSGEQVSSGLLRLAARYPVDCVVGPNDSYILEQLAGALGDVPVYSGGYATAYTLGGARISLVLPAGDVSIRIGDTTILKSRGEYDILEGTGSANICLYPGGVMSLTAAKGRDPALLGGLLYGETRFRLPVR